MKFEKKIFLLCSLVCLSLEARFVTYSFSGGRFGDNLLAYIHALWVSYTYDIPLLYKPFDNSDKLKLHILHMPFENVGTGEIDQVIDFSQLTGKQEKLPISNAPKKLYVIPYFPHCKADIGNRFHFDIDWKDERFKKLLQTELAPLYPVQNLTLPKNCHLVALHVRTGAGHDKIFQLRNLDGVENQEMQQPTKEISPKSIFRSFGTRSRGIPPISTKSKFADKLHPLKFACDAFYINQLRKLSELLNDEPMYVHLFTDSSSPAELANLYKKLVNKENITFGYRTVGNLHNTNIIEDFFALQQFDYLIRAESNFSIVAGLLKNYALTIFPKTYSWKGNILEIDSVEIQDGRIAQIADPKSKSKLKALFQGMLF